jgi:putative addiction module component (TIGR02574 family)
MSEAFNQVHQQAKTLTDEERAELAYLLLASLDLQAVGQSEEDLNVTLARRTAEIVTGTVNGRPAEEVHAEIRKRYA